MLFFVLSCAEGWVNLYQKLEIEKNTVCGKVISSKKLLSNFIKKYANLVLDSYGTLTPEIVTVCGGRRSVFSRIHMFGPYPDQTYPGSWIRYNFLTLIKSKRLLQTNKQWRRLKGAAITQWIHVRLPSCGPGFESQAHHLRTLFPFIVKFCVIFFSVGGQLLIKSCERLFTNRLNNKPTTLSLNWHLKILFYVQSFWPETEK